MDCRADMKVSFVLPFVGVSFLATGWNDGDAVTVHAFNGLVDIGTRAIGGNGIFDLSSLGTITSLLFDDASSEDGGGMSFGNFVINLAASGPPDLGSDVPLPAALPLLMAGIGALGGLRTLKRG
jgi:hypothetical protein